MRRRSFGLPLWVALVSACAPSMEPVARVAVRPTELTLRYAEVLTVDIEFDILEPLEGTQQLRVFVHLLDEPGVVLRTFDHPFPGDWLEGGRVRHSLRIHQSALGPPLRAGRYDLTVGLYDAEGRRWPLATDAEEVDDMEYRVAEIAVAEPEAVPMFRFSEVWKPIEAGLDRQIMGRRWLVDSGSIWITEAPEVGAIWMLLQIPPAKAGVSRLKLAPEAEIPAVVVTSECGGEVAELTGSGRHELELGVRGEAAQETGECRITLEPNYHLVENGSPERRTVLLEALAWRAAD